MRWAPPLGLVGLYLLVQFSVLPAIHWGDTLRVFRYAASWPDVPFDHHALRIGLVLPARLSQSLLGYGPVSFYTVALGYGVAMVVGTYLAGRHLFGRVSAVAATTLLILSPYVVNTDEFLTSGLILPDLPAAAAFTLGVGLLIAGLQHEDETHRRRYLVAAGVAFGLAYLIREFVPAMYLVVPLAFVLWRIPLRRSVWTLGPMAAMLGIELATSTFVFGDPLSRLRVSSEHGSTLADPITTRETFGFWLRAFTEGNEGQLLLVCLGLLVVGTMVTRDRRLVLLLAWFGSLFAALLALGGLLDPAAPSLRIVLTRYWFPVFPALVLGGVGSVTLAYEAARRSGRRPLAVAAVGAVGAITLLATVQVALPATRTMSTAEGDDAWLELRAWLGEAGGSYDAIATDSRSDLMLDVYRYELVGGEELWDGAIIEFDHGLASPPEEVLDEYVVLYAPPGPTEPPPTDIEVLFESSDGTLVVVDRTG